MPSTSKQLIDYAINIFYGINDSKLLDLFHHLEVAILQLSSQPF
jgi:hypothetical protein